MTSEGSLARLSTWLDSIHWKPIVGSSAIVLSWLYLNLPTLQWIGQAFAELSPFNLLLLGIGSLLLLWQGIRYRYHFNHFNHPFKSSAVLGLRPAPFVLMVGSGLAAIAVRWLIDFEQLPALLFVLGTYGLLGLFLDDILWRKGLPAATAIACVFPFWLQFTMGLGYPARILTAHVVEMILAKFHIAALSSEDIIVLDTGIARVDLPCSGLKSLWVGTLLLLGATWIEGRRIGAGWLLVSITNLALLVLANIGRILTLVIVAIVLKQPTIAEILHIPLGVMGFVAVCFTTWGLLQRVPRYSDNTPSHGQKSLDLLQRHQRKPENQRKPEKTSGNAVNSLLASVGVAACLIALTFIPLPSKSIVPMALGQLEWSPHMQVESVPLTEIEREFFATHPGAVAEEKRFQFQGVSGSLLLVSSPTWRAHHPPELCYVSSGFQVNHMERQQLTDDILGRWLSLDGGKYSATYWFQSPQQTTDDYLARSWQEITRQDSEWILISVLFDQSHTANEPEIQAFLSSIHDTLDQGWHTHS